MSDDYKALFISDIHMSNKLPHAKPSKDGRTDRLDDQIRLWKRVRKTAKDQKVNAIYVLGDLFDKSLVDAVTLTCTVECIVSLTEVSQVYILPGNHDAVTTSGGRFTVEAFGAMQHARLVYMEQPWITHPTNKTHLVFWPVPFMPIKDTLIQLAKYRADIASSVGILGALRGKARHILLMHNSILGCKHMGWVCNDGMDGDSVCEGFDEVITGHFHTTQKFGGGKGLYLGAPMHHRFDDVGRDAKYWVKTWKDAKLVGTHSFAGRCPEFHEWSWNDGDVDDLKAVRKGDYLKIRVEATHAETLSIRAEVEELRDSLVANGRRVIPVKYKTIYHHKKARIEGSSESVMGINELIASYPDSGDVETKGLDVASLKKLGRKTFEEVLRRGLA